MSQKLFIPLLYICSLLLSLSYSIALDTGINKNNIAFKVKVEFCFLEKKEKIDIEWNDVKKVRGLPANNNYRIELLTNHYLQRSTDNLLCEERELLNVTNTESYKWKIPKLTKGNYYGILITVEGTNIYGLSRRLDYVPNINKFLSSNTTDVEHFINNTQNEVVYFYEDEVQKIEVEEEQPLAENSSNMNASNITLASKKISKSVRNYVIIIIVALVIIAVLLSILAFTFYRKNKKTKQNVKKILVAQKEREALQSIDIKSEAAESEIVREKLKQEALEKERQKVYESIKEKNLLTVEGNSIIFPTGASDAVSNTFSNSNTDFSWHGMEVMTFNTSSKNNTGPNKNSTLPSLSITPLAAPKKIDYDAIGLAVDDKIQKQEEAAKKKEIDAKAEDDKPKEVEIQILNSEEPEKTIVTNPNSTVKFKI